MQMINPYLNFGGNAQEAFDFYKSVFGGEFAMVMRFKDGPDGEKMPAELGEQIMHIALPIGKSTMLMASDAPEAMGFKLQQGTNFYISLHPDSEEEGRKIFDALSAGGVVNMPFQLQFWGDLFGEFTDKFGIKWLMSFNEKYLDKKI